MAKIKIRMGQNEVEIDSRDFYVDNQSVGRVIEEVSEHLRSNSPPPAEAEAPPADPYGGPGAEGVAGWDAPASQQRQQPGAGLGHLSSLADAEVHEPEFSSPVQVSGREVKSKLGILEKDLFFDKPRTVSETVGQLREYGWAACPLEVSKTMAKMVIHRELKKDSHNDRVYYSAKRLLVG